MGELVFVGLGLFDEKDITLKGLDAARAADAVFAEFYTSSLRAPTLATLQLLFGKPIKLLTRKDEEQGSEFPNPPRPGTAVLPSPAVPMPPPTPSDLRLPPP